MKEITEAPTIRRPGPPVDDDQLVKVTVWVIPSAMEALNAAAERHGDTKTNTINRALTWYDQSTKPLARWTVRRLLLILGCCWPFAAAYAMWDIPKPVLIASAVVTSMVAVPLSRWLNWRPR